MKHYLKSSVLRSLGIFSIALVIALSMIVVAGNYSASQSSGTSVTTCYNKKSGALRYLVKGKCKRSERVLSISRVGPQGSAGATGTTGPAGPSGPAGPAGTAGVTQGVSGQDVSASASIGGSKVTGLRIGANPVGTLERSDDSLNLTSSKWVQATATVQIAGPENTDNDIDTGVVQCMIKRAPAGSAESSFQSFASSLTSTVEPTNTERYVGLVTVTGGMELTAGNWDFLVDCINTGGLSLNYRGVALNVVTVG